MSYRVCNLPKYNAESSFAEGSFATLGAPRKARLSQWGESPHPASLGQAQVLDFIGNKKGIG